MGRTPCCEKIGLNRGKWTAEEDEKLVNYINANGEGSWRSLPKNAGLLRCGKSCRLRWINYLRTDVKRGNFTEQEEENIVKLHKTLGNRWSLIASQIPGRTDNEIKNYWNSHLSRKIYRYRYVGEATLSTEDMVKMVKKKKIGRASRTEATKDSTNATDSNSSVSRSRITKKDPSNAATAEQPSSSYHSPVASAVPVEAAGKKDMIGLESSGINEGGKSASLSDSVSSCDTLSFLGWPDALMLSPNDEQLLEMLGPCTEVGDEISMHPNYFLEDKTTTDQCPNERDELMMNADNMPTSEEMDCGGGGGDGGSWSSSLDSAGLYDYLSPIVSYFTDDVLQWDHNGAGNKLNLWSEEDAILTWS